MQRNHRKAFTLLEIVVSTILLAIGVLGYAAVTARLARAFVLNGQRERSADLISGKREEMLRLGCAAITSGSNNNFDLALTWNVGGQQGIARPIVISATRPGATELMHDSLRTSVPCS
ncbi:MAG: prepilin-type N-terminal cleavage/methylation domain-containing protein [Gemmatimonadaceae bacterium]|nr:prepilin-type N-terminal cleavage/methylation domain-containing protein [Gemmatimonadaceae bacterium]